MKKQIMFCVGIGVLIICTTNCHAAVADPNACIYTSSGSEWKACTWGNTNVETCGEAQGWIPIYRCKAGYYYEKGYAPTSCTSSCLACPENGTSNPGDNEGITKCYQKPGSHIDATGTYKVTADCYYKE